MRQKENDRELIRQEIINRIQSGFPGSLVIHIGTGSPGDDYNDGTEQFEALMVKDEDFKRFVLFTAKLEEELAEPNDFFINVDSINPELTKEYRLEQYNDEKAKRDASRYISAKHEKLFIEAFAQTAICFAAILTISDFSEMELTRVSVKPSWDENGKNGDKHSDAVRGTAISAESSIKVAS